MSSSPLRLAPRYHRGDRRCNWKAWRRATAGPAALDRMPACRSVADGDGDRARGPEGRDDRGMFARPSGDDHHEVVRAGAERHVLREEPSPEALGVDHPEALAILRTEAVEPHAGALPDRPLDVGLGPARVRERSRVLWAEDDERLTAAFSARQYEYFPGWPSVARSSRPGRAPPIFWRVRRTARPITALARWPWPSALAPALIARYLTIGPLTMRSGVHGCVVVWIAFRLKRGSASARIAATTTGRCPGRAPASARLAAIASRVATPRRGASIAITSALRGARGPRIRATRSAVGGSTGMPSDQPSARAKSWNRSMSAGAVTVAATGADAATGGAGSRVSAAITRSTTTSDPATTSSITVAGRDAPGFRQSVTGPAPARSTSSSATRASRTSALGFELSRMPTRTPRRFPRRRASGLTSPAVVPSGLKRLRRLIAREYKPARGRPRVRPPPRRRPRARRA